MSEYHDIDRERAARYYELRGHHGTAAKLRSGKHDSGYPAILAIMKEVREENAEAVIIASDQLARVAAVFDTYADLHRAKDTREADQKAATNMGYSMECDEAADALLGAFGDPQRESR